MQGQRRCGDDAWLSFRPFREGAREAFRQGAHMNGEFGRLMDFEIDPDQSEINRQRFERLGARLQSASSLIDGLDHTGVSRNPAGDGLRWSVEENTRPKGVLGVGDGTGDVGGVSAFGWFAWIEAVAGGELRLNTIHTEGAPVGAAQIPGNQIPAMSSGHEAMGFDGAVAGLAIASAVTEAQDIVVATSTRDGGKNVEVDGRAGIRKGDDESMQSRDATTQARRQNLLELHERSQRGFLDAGDSPARGRAQSDGDSNGFIVVKKKRRQIGASSKLISTGSTGGGMHGIAKSAQTVDVAAQGARSNLQAGREVGAGPVTLGLEQRKQPKKPCRSLQHTGETIAFIEDRSCPQLLIPSWLSIRASRTERVVKLSRADRTDIEHSRRQS